MPDRLATYATDVLVAEARRLEQRLIQGSARADEIDTFVSLELEIAARDQQALVLDGVVDPRD